MDYFTTCSSYQWREKYISARSLDAYRRVQPRERQQVTYKICIRPSIEKCNMPRSKPNIIVTGTPGVGKTTLCESLASTTDLLHLAINRVAQERGCHDGWDDALNSWVVDEDKVRRPEEEEESNPPILDAIEDEVKQGGYLIDWHACDLFPQSWIDLVIVLRSDSTPLYDRLKTRNYPDQKLQENMDAEIMEVLLNEAREAFDPELVVELQSNTSEDMESNASRVETWIEQWTQNRCNEATPHTRSP
ncbi:MAG: hypothetical protein Q9169_003791 [Polycauliona sp. 2 TL-2023]